MSDARPWWTRRDFLKGSGAAAMTGAYGMSGSLGWAAEIPDKFDGTGFKLKAPEPNPKSGGVLRVASPTGRRISMCISPARSTTSVPKDACSTI
jgi:hypothetical protein